MKKSSKKHTSPTFTERDLTHLQTLTAALHTAIEANPFANLDEYFMAFLVSKGYRHQSHNLLVGPCLFDGTQVSVGLEMPWKGPVSSCPTCDKQGRAWAWATPMWEELITFHRTKNRVGGGK